MTYRSPLPPWAHQAEYPRRVEARPALSDADNVFALLAEMGTGKTKMALDEWGEMVDGGEVENLLVLAPAGSYRNWYSAKTETERSELEKNLAPTLLVRTRAAPWVSGGKVEVRRGIERMLRHSGPRALFVNVEALSTVKDAIAACEALLETGRTTILVDESTRVKNMTAARTKTLHRLRQHRNSAVRRIMSGLVTPRDPLDLFAQYWFLDWRILKQRSFFAFKQRYAVTRRVRFAGNTRDTEIVVGFRNQEELQGLIAPWSYRVLLEDCLDMPGEVFQFRTVRVTDEQRRLILELRRTATTQLDSGAHVTTTMKMATLTRIDQILLGWVEDEEGGHHPVKTHRYEELVELLEDHSGKAIIWTSFQESAERAVEALNAAFGKGSAALFYGPNRSTRHLEEARFLGDPACRFMVSTMAAGGVGNTWNVATLRVYLNNSNDLEHRLQSEKRNYRGGQTQRVTSVDMVGDGVSVELKKIESLRKKLDLASLISGDKYRDWLV